MAPSSTMGAVMPPSRKAPTKVVVFQWPCGTGARQRCPRTARPHRLAILVDAPVSSTKTSLSGVEAGLGLEPGPSALQHVQALLLAGMRGFF